MFYFKHIIKLILFCLAYILSLSVKAQPDNISGLVLWLKADSGVIYDVNNKVSIWSDASGNGIHFTQTNQSLQPTYITSVDSLNYKPSVRFNNSVLNTTQPITIGTIFILSNYHFNEFQGFSGLFTRISVVDGNTDYLIISNSVGTFFYGSIIGSNLFINNIQTYNFSPLKRPKIIYGYLNTPILWEDIALGLDRSLGGRFWRGDVFEIIVFNRVLQANEVSQVFTYLMNKYAPPINLPNDTLLATFCPFTIKGQGYFTSYQWSNGSTADSIVVLQSGTYKITATDIFGRQSVDSISVRFPIQSLQNNYFLCYQDSIMLETGLSNSDYNFLWQNGDTNSFFVVNSPGQYFVHITDSLNCSYFSDTIYVQSDTFFFENVLNDSAFICLGDTLNANHVAAINYLWSTNATSYYILPQTSQWYYVTLTNTNNCKLIDSCFVTLKGVKPQPSISKNNLCYASPTFYFGNSTGNIEQWRWTFQDSIVQYGQQVSFLYNQAGIYRTILYVIDSNSCDGIIVSFDTIYPPPKAAFINNNGCSGLHTTFVSLSISQDTINEYYWNINNQNYQGSQINVDLNPLQYTISHWIVTKHGCRDSIVQVINILNASQPISADANFPNNGVNLNNKNIQLKWNNHQQLSLIELSYKNDFSTIVYRSTPSYNCELTILSVLADTTVYWRIWTYNACNDSVSSQNYYFKTYNCNSVDGLSLWLKSDSGIVKDANNRISEWKDISGNNLNFTQSNNNFKPLYVGSVDSLNYKPSVYFNNSKLILTQSISIGTFFILANYHNNVFINYGGLLTRVQTNDGNTDYLLVGSDGGTSFYPSILGQNLFINNVQTSNFSPLPRLKIIRGVLSPTVFWSDLGIGFDRSDGTRFWKGDITELAVYDRNLNNQEISKIEKYLMDKYAPPVLLPNDTVLTSFCPFAIVPRGYFTSYQWNTGETSDTLIVQQSGKYIVTATDIFGRISKDSIIVTFPSTNIKDTVIVCMGDSVLITSSLGNIVDYQWSNSNNKSYGYVNEHGWYYLTITDRYACTRIDSFFVRVDSLSISQLFGQDTTFLCDGNYLTIQQNTQFPMIQYLWTPTNDTTHNTIVQYSNWYTVLVKDINQCTGKDSIFVNILGKAPVAQFSASHTCLNQYTTLTSTSFSQDSSVLNYWQWIINNTDTLFGNSAPYLFENYGYQNVKLIVGTNTGCYSTYNDSVIVHPLPIINFNVSGFCEQQSSQFISINSIPFGQIVDYLWNFGDGHSSIDINPQHTYSQSGIYQVSYTAISNEGCQKTISKEIEIKYTPRAGFVHGSSCTQKSTFFTDTSKTLSYYPIIQWKWDFGDGNTSSIQFPSHTYLQTGNYNVSMVIKILNGCTDTAKKLIQVSSSPQASFVHDSACIYQPLNLHDVSSVQNGTIQSRKWFIGSNYYSNNQFVTIVPQQTGNMPITLIVESNTQCTDSLTKILEVKPKPNVSFSADSYYGTAPLTVNFQNNSDFGSVYWQFGDGQISTQFNPQHTYTDTGNYTVWLRLTNIYGCYDSLSKIIMVVPTLMDLSVDDIHIQSYSTYYSVSAKIANAGTFPIENPEIQLWANGRFMIAETLLDTLYSGDILWYTFNGKINTQFLNPTYVCVHGAVNSTFDEITTINNTYCKAVEEKEQVLNFYPNPVYDKFSIEYYLIENQEVTVSIFDLTGKLVFNNNFFALQKYNKADVDVSNLSKGVYIIKLQTQQISFKSLIIKL